MIAFKDPLFDAQLLRTLGHASYQGSTVGECLAAAVEIKDGDRESWHRAFNKLADRSFAAAEASEERGHRKSAEHAFLRASSYYRAAFIFHLEAPLPDLALRGYRRQREAFSRAARLMARPPEQLSIPFEGHSLPGWFCSAGEGRRPVVISVGGYDSTAEESYLWNARAALDRGHHAIVFDGPGQGGVLFEQGVPFRPDWGPVVSAVIDAGLARPEVDPARVVVVGESFGGYLAVKAAARDPRIAACVLDPAQVSLFRATLARLPLPASLKADLPNGPGWLIPPLRSLLALVAKRPTAGWGLRRGMSTHGLSTPWEYVAETARYDNTRVIGEVRCPTLVCDAAEDDLAAFAREFFDALRCEKGYLRFTAAEGAGDHCVAGNRPLFHERVFDWIDEKLGAAP